MTIVFNNIVLDSRASGFFFNQEIKTHMNDFLLPIETPTCKTTNVVPPPTLAA